MRLIAFPAGSRRTRSGSASSKKRQSVFWFFFKLPPGGGCSGCDLLVTCIRCSRGSSTVFQVVCHVQVWWWFIWCEVDDGSGEKRATSPGAMDGCFCSVWCWKCILDLFIVRFGPCCPPFIWQSSLTLHLEGFFCGILTLLNFKRCFFCSRRAFILG